MDAVLGSTPVSNRMLWIGRIVSAVPVFMLLISGIMKLVLAATGNPEMAEGFNGLGWDPKYALTLAILEIGSTLVYLFPRTAVLGAVLLTGYFGGAIATHLRIGDPSLVGALGLGILVWVGLYLREPRLRQLIPFRA